MRVNGLTSQDLADMGIIDTTEVVYNPDYDTLFQEETRPELEGFERGTLTHSGAIAVDTGIFTGRSPKDKYIVRDDTTRDTLWWNDQGTGKNDNQPLSQETWQALKTCVTQQLSGKRLFVIDAFCGANPDSRLSVRFITEVAWQAHFVKNMFIQPNEEELATFKPDFVVMNGAKCTNPNWQEQGLNSENFIAFNLTERMQLIGGSWYGGEMKKGLFAVMNYLLPLKGIASMHCSANVGKAGDVAVFFGLSGTGKTTLSTDPDRQLIGDDEHGWDDDGVFNFEGVATPKPSTFLSRPSRKFTVLFAAMPCWKTWWYAPMAAWTMPTAAKRRIPASPTRSITSTTSFNPYLKRDTQRK